MERGFTLSVVVCSCLAASAARADAPPIPETVADGAKLEEVYADERFFEGPAWDPAAGKLYFTAFGKDSQQVLRLEEPGKVHVWMDRSEGVNGTFLSLEGRLLGAQAYGHRLLDLALGGERASDARILLNQPSLHQPNDVCQTIAGDIYFTDPDFKEQKTSAVYRLSRDGKLEKVISDMPLPNGLIASNDAKTLYVGDSHEKLWRAYPIRDDGSVGEGRVFFDPETENRADPDGMTIDERGNLYFSGRGGVWVADPQGKALGLIAVPEFCSNAAFGGSDLKTLFLTCDKKVYRLSMKVRGGAGAGALDPDARYVFGKDSERREGVPRGTVTKHSFRSKVFENTLREYWLYVPAQHQPEAPAAVMVFQDGHAYVAEDGQFRVPIVFDNLIHEKSMPATIGIFINPGHRVAEDDGEEKLPQPAWRASNRSIEYDSLDDRYARFLLEEMLPEVAKSYKLTEDPERRAICGISSGGICAFTVAWQRPDAFRKVLSHVGSFTNIRGGHVYPALIRKETKRPMRVFLQDGKRDLDNRYGNWWLANLEMEASLRFAGYDCKFVGGEGAHNGRHGGAILPESLRWLWR
jgi:enterochelin esterase family protein